MQNLKNTTRLRDRKYVMIEQQIPPPIRETSWWQFKPEYFPQPSHKHALGENKLRSQAKNSLAHTTKHVPQMAPHHNPTYKIILRHANKKVEKNNLLTQECRTRKSSELYRTRIRTVICKPTIILRQLHWRCIINTCAVFESTKRDQHYTMNV